MTLRHPRVLRVCLIGLVFAALGFFVIDRVVNLIREKRLPKNIAIVREGALYRSGQMEPTHLEEVIKKFHIRTVIQLNPEPKNQWEEDVARQCGARVVKIPMPGTGRGETDDFARVLEIVRDASQQPVLVHCAAGANRTGMACALYRMMDEGWVHADAVREMDSKGFDHRVDLPKLLLEVHDVLVCRERGKGMRE
ncbi:tyrosine-protein phosphatase [bacterium]|nr:tyrosine-protein phosphatase [bacterium]